MESVLVTEFREKLRAARRVKDPFIRAERVRALGMLDDPRVVGALIPFLDPGETPMVRTAAAAAIGQVGSAWAVEPLVRCLADPWYDVRCQAAKALGRTGNLRATEPLNRRLLQEEDGYAAAAIIEALGPLGNASSAHPLLAHIWRYPRRVEEALVQIGPPVVEALIQTLTAKSAPARLIAATALGRIGDARALQPLGRLLTKSSDISLLTAVVRSLRALGWKGGDRSTKALKIGLLVTGDWDALARMGKPAVKLLIHALRHRDRAVRCGAAVALAEIGDAEAVPALVKCFQVWQTKDPPTRRAAARALGQLGDGRAVEPLLAFVQDDGPALYREKRHEAIAALTRIGDARVAPALADIALKDRSVERRQEAIVGLGACPGPGIVEILHGLLTDPSLAIRKGAAESLVRQGWEPQSPTDTVAVLIANNCWNELGSQGRHLVPALIDALQHEPEPVQPWIARALGQTGDLCATQSVLAWLFAHPAQILDETDCKGWIDDLRPLLGDYSAPIVHAACYARKRTHVLRESHSVTEHAYTYDLDAGDHAIRRLGELDTAVATNVLFLIADKPDASVEVSLSENEWGGGVTQGPLGFAEQREIACRALEGRLGARYDPSAYEVHENWSLLS